MIDGTGGKAERVPCEGEYDAKIYRIVAAGDECPKDLKARWAGNQQIFCVFLEGKPS